MLVKGYRYVCYTQIDKAMMPPPMTGLTLRQWFAGLALVNPEFMKNVPESERAAEAVKFADQLISALDVPRVPTLESMAPPSNEELSTWEKKVEVDNAASIRRGKDTVAPSSRARHRDAFFPLRPRRHGEHDDVTE